MEPTDDVLGTLETSGWAVEWVRDDIGDPTGEVAVAPLADRTLSYELHARLVLGDRVDLTWSEGSYAAPAEGDLRLTLTIPPEAYVSDAQAVTLADLVVTVVVLAADAPLDELPVGPARVAWPSGPDLAPQLLDQEVATELAPGGVLGKAGPPLAKDERSDGSAPADEVAL